jgi:hypothetical protein
MEHFESNYELDDSCLKLSIERNFIMKDIEKIDTFKTPRDKYISINNACKTLICKYLNKIY